MSNYSQQIRKQKEARVQLQNNNSALRNHIYDLNNNRRQLEARLTQVKQLQQSVERGLNGRAEDVASAQSEVARKIGDAVTMQGFTDETISEITKSIEPTLANDYYGSTINRTLSNEIRRIEDEIEEANRLINDANSRIENNNNSIRIINSNIRNLQAVQSHELANG